MGNVISLDPLIKRVCDGVVDFGYELAVKHAAYVYYLQRNLQALETNLEDLQTLRKELIRRIKVKEGHQMQTGERVNLWITRVDREIATGDKLKAEGDRQLDRLCLAGICSTHYFSSSVFGGQVDKCVKELNSLNIIGEGFTDEDLVVKVPVELDRGTEKLCGPTVGLVEKLAEVLKYLEKENVGIVGIYGQGGVGKTTLLKKINNHFVGNGSERFLVAWIDVPKDVNLEAIQQAVGEKIGLPAELKDTSMEKKAEYIFKKLQQNKIILLLDDIRKAINLSEIGIPPSDCLNESKVVFTTRPQHVSIKMAPKPGRSTSVETLGDEQAWQLFVMMAGEDIIDSHPQIPQLARRVTEKCGGLPLALSIIGKAMSCEREPKVWEHTAKSFERPSLHSKAHLEADGDSMSELFSILRYSYDSLPNERYKSCFLYCALLPEAGEIQKKAIIERWVFEDFWTDCDEDDLYSHYEARCILSVLANSCLLEDGKDWVKMHDVVRSMALWIGEEDTLSMAGMELEEAPSVRMWEQKKRVSLMYNDIQKLTEVPVCPNLLTLYLCRNSQLNEICNGFFESMGMLTVLDLSKTGVEELPESISGLVSLKFLNISSTKITELPIVLINLKELRYLDLSGLENLRLHRKNQIFCHLSSLQYLGMFACTYYYYYEEEGEISIGGDDEILLEELQVLENLKVLEISLQSFSSLMKLFNNRRLLKKTRILSLNNFTGTESIDISLLAQSKHLDTLTIIGCDFKELKNSHESADVILKSSTSSVLTQMISFNSITRVAVGGCEYLEDITCVVSIPNLRHLHVCDCERLREIISREKIGEVLAGNGEELFSNLAILGLDGLPELKSIYPSNTLSLRFLYNLTVQNCPQLKKLPLDPNSSVLGCSQIRLEAEEEWWDAIEWEDDAVKAALLPRFNLNNLS